MRAVERIKNHFEIVFGGNAAKYYKNAILQRVLRKRARWSRNGHLIFSPYPNIKATLREDDDLTLKVYLDGLDSAIVETVRNYLRPGMTVLDVGANAGLYSLVFASLVGPKGTVYAFEPVPQLSARITENAKLNDLPNIKTFDLAVGARTEKIKLHLSKGRGDGWASIYEWSHTGNEFIYVDVVTLDRWVQELGIETIDLLKIDVEGAELDVYLGSQALFKSGVVKAVLMEFNKETQAGANISSQDLCQALIQNGYEWFRLPWSSVKTDPVCWDNLERLCDLIAIRKETG